MGSLSLPPDINRSGADFTLERDEAGKLCIRYALAAVKKVGMAAMQAVVAARPDVVDVSSGVCGPDGLLKDADKVVAFVRGAKEALAATTTPEAAAA